MGLAGRLELAKQLSPPLNGPVLQVSQGGALGDSLLCLLF